MPGFITIFHRIAHLFGWNVGRIASWTDDDGGAFVAFRCDGCGELQGIERIPDRRNDR
jgi:hypothetical protein